MRGTLTKVEKCKLSVKTGGGQGYCFYLVSIAGNAYTNKMENLRNITGPSSF